MKFLRDLHDQVAPNFEKGGRFEKLYPVWEMHDTGFFTPPDVTKTGSHVRDGIDLKRMMITVVIALVPCVAMAMYNTGYQALLAMARGGAALDNWQMALYGATGLGADFSNPIACLLLGALYFAPIYAVCMLTGAAVEIGGAVIRGHEVNEGFLVTGLLLPLTLPATIPLWMVAMGIAFGLIFGKEVFGGTGMNFLNPALVARAFLFFAYPAALSGEIPWIAADLTSVDSYTGATLLAQAAESGQALGGYDWWDAFWGFIPGSMGETSAAASLIGCAVLLWTRIGSGRTMVGVVIGTIGMSLVLNLTGSDTNPMFGVTWYWHMVLGGWALGTVFMATDPVSSAFTEPGKFYYGLFIGILCVLIRVVNPAYPEGMMLAILFMNMFAPLIDHFVVQGNIKRESRAMQHSTGYIIGFTAAVCLVCSVFVAGSAVSLKDRQEANVVLDRQEKVLVVSGLMREGEGLSAEEVGQLFDSRVKARAVNLADGSYNEEVNATTYDQRVAKDPALSRQAPDNPAKVRRLPNVGLVFQVQSDAGGLDSIIIPIEGMGLWGTLYGYLALSPDTRSIKGITFYQHKETPGLGGEVDNPRWKSLWKGRLAFDDKWSPKIGVIKGRAGTAEADPYRVDGLSGATITSRGVDKLVRYWLGDSGFGPYLQSVRAGQS